MKNADMPAMPNLEAVDASGNVYQHTEYTGLTKREQLAAMVMQGLCSHRGDGNNPVHVAEDAVMYADALLAELERTK